MFERFSQTRRVLDHGELSTEPDDRLVAIAEKAS